MVTLLTHSPSITLSYPLLSPALPLPIWPSLASPLSLPGLSVIVKAFLSFSICSSYPDGPEDIGPQISADIDDIGSDDEEIHHIEICRDESGFGFSIRGGAEYHSSLFVLRIAEGGAAEKEGRLQVSPQCLFWVDLKRWDTLRDHVERVVAFLS